MPLCNFCNLKETRSRRFTLPFTCSECANNKDNYRNMFNLPEENNNEEIIYIDNKGQEITINELTELNIVNEAEIKPIDKSIDMNNFKDNLLASLYSQVEYLKHIIQIKDNQIEESNLHIRALLTRESDIYNHPVQPKKESQCAIESQDCSSTENTDNDDDRNVFYDSYDIDFVKDAQYVAQKEANLCYQLNEIRKHHHEIYRNYVKAKEGNETKSNDTNGKDVFDTNYYLHDEDKKHPDEVWNSFNCG